MAATTISRSVWTNDTGTPSTPVGDGTIINNARLQEIYANIDALIAATITFGGLVNAEGLGTHLFSAGGTGGNVFRLRNTAAGTTNYTRVEVLNDASVGGYVAVGASTSTYGDPIPASGVGFYGDGAAGVALAATHASGTLRFQSGGFTERMRVSTSGMVGIGTVIPWAGLHVAAGTIIAEGAAVSAPLGLTINGVTASPDWAQIVFGDGSGYRLNFGTRSGGNFVSRMQIYDTGVLRVGSGSAGSPAYAFLSETDTGLYNSGSALDIATKAVQRVKVSGGATTTTMELIGQAFGTGALGGSLLTIHRNSSGAGAPGTLRIIDKGGSNRYLWVASTADVYTGTTAPTESGGDTTGTVVGTQTSTRDTKRDVRRFDDAPGALALLLRTPIYHFRYRESDPDTDHVGILAEDSPEFTRYGRTAFDPVNAFGYTVSAIQALVARVAALEARTARA